MAVFRRNPRLEDDLRGEGPYAAALHDAAEAVIAGARDAAPVAEGDYRDGLEAIVTEAADGEVVGRANATDWKSHFIEWGTVDTPVHAPLRRGVEAAGLTFEPKSR